MNTELEGYLKGVLPLLDEEKVAQLLAKGAHVVDKVYDIAQADERLKGVLESIYAAGTCRALINKLDGNKALAEQGFNNYSDFYFNCEANPTELSKLADKDVIVRDDPKRFWKKLIENLHWDVPEAEAFRLFSGFLFSVTKDTALPTNRDKLERAYNYLVFTLKRHSIAVTDFADWEKKIRDVLPDALDIKPAMMLTKNESLGEALKELEKLKEDSSPYIMMTGMNYFSTGYVISTSGKVNWSTGGGGAGGSANGGNGGAGYVVAGGAGGGVVNTTKSKRSKYRLIY